MCLFALIIEAFFLLQAPIAVGIIALGVVGGLAYALVKPDQMNEKQAKEKVS